MQTKQAIQAQANVIRITSVSVGDVYKRFEDSTYSSDRTYYGVVNAVHNDGEKTIIEATEYRVDYTSVDVSYKIIKGMDDVAIFPASPDDLLAVFVQGKEAVNKRITESKEALIKDEKLLTEIEALADGTRIKELKQMSYKELSQDEYSRKLQEINV